jgi:ankyrin repeat protein
MPRTSIIVVLLSLLNTLPAYADINSDLLDVAKKGDTKAVKALLDNGADVNAKNNTGATALIEAAIKGYADTVKALLNSGADIKVRDIGNFTALVWAATLGHTDIVQALIDEGADINAKANPGLPALMLAAMNGHASTVKVLLENGADVNAIGFDNMTALKLLIEKGNTEIAKLLKQYQTKSKQTPEPMVYKGNASTEIFHKPGCQYYESKLCIAEFDNREEAIAAGFKPCKVCNP